MFCAIVVLEKDKKMNDPFENFHRLRLAAKCDEDFDEALAELKKIEDNQPLYPNILVLKGICIQLGSENSPYELYDAEAAFKAAIEIDKNCFDALIEIGSFYNTNEGNPEKALPYYEKALEIAQSQFTEAIQGCAECYSEIKSPEDAFEFIEENIKKPVDEDKINAIKSHIKKYSRRSPDKK